MKSLLLLEVTYSQVPGVKTQTSLGSWPFVYNTSLGRVKGGKGAPTADWVS